MTDKENQKEVEALDQHAKAPHSLLNADPNKEDTNSSSELKKVSMRDGATKIGLHSVKNLLGTAKQLSLFNDSSVEEFSQRYGIKLENSIERYGINLTDVQLQMMEGILKGLSETNYEGNLSPLDKTDLAREKYQSKELPETYKYTSKIPRLVAPQSQLLDWGGFNKNSIGDKAAAIEALRHLGTTQFCFYYDRLALNEHGEAKKHKNGGWVKEEVTAVDTLFTIKEIRDEKTKKIQYYEILPSPIFLDQRESYFMLIPFGWRKEVQKVLARRKISSYTFRFLLFLRYHYELKRRSKQPLEVRLHWEEIAIAIKMPETVYKRKKDRACQILEEAYIVAKALGYLKSYSRETVVDILELNEKKYYNPERFLEIDTNVQPIPVSSDAAKSLFDFFYAEKQRIDPNQRIPMGEPRNSHLRAFDQLLKARSADDIKKLLLWGLNRRFWCTRLATPSKLRDNFDEGWAEMTFSSNKSPDTLIENNKKYVQNTIQKIHPLLPKTVKIEIGSQYVEFRTAGSAQTSIIMYRDNGFREQFENILRKIGVNYTA